MDPLPDIVLQAISLPIPISIPCSLFVAHSSYEHSKPPPQTKPPTTKTKTQHLYHHDSPSSPPHPHFLSLLPPIPSLTPRPRTSTPNPPSLASTNSLHPTITNLTSLLTSHPAYASEPDAVR
ncbi:hypothetical protein G7Y79_00003g009360 [Physcia stellaris]|nr:hypothetical protein G7Y79_00003g009360 [Physcia stellaris]